MQSETHCAQTNAPGISAVLSALGNGTIDFSEFKLVAMRETNVNEDGNIIAISF